jgi:Lar family restriction alleviation protein
MSETKLKPCPFCYGEAGTFHNDCLHNILLWGVECLECGALVWVFPDETEQDAINKWNFRVEPPTPGGAIVPAGNERMHDG